MSKRIKSKKQMKKNHGKGKGKGDMMEEKSLKYSKHVKMDKLPEFYYSFWIF
jgi:hypothetical protein